MDGSIETRVFEWDQESSSEIRKDEQNTFWFCKHHLCCDVPSRYELSNADYYYYYFDWPNVEATISLKFVEYLMVSQAIFVLRRSYLVRVIKRSLILSSFRLTRRRGNCQFKVFFIVCWNVKRKKRGLYFLISSVKSCQILTKTTLLIWNSFKYKMKYANM